MKRTTFAESQNWIFPKKKWHLTCFFRCAPFSTNTGAEPDYLASNQRQPEPDYLTSTGYFEDWEYYDEAEDANDRNNFSAMSTIMIMMKAQNMKKISEGKSQKWKLSLNLSSRGISGLPQQWSVPAPKVSETFHCCVSSLILMIRCVPYKMTFNISIFQYFNSILFLILMIRCVPYKMTRMVISPTNSGTSLRTRHKDVRMDDQFYMIMIMKILYMYIVKNRIIFMFFVLILSSNLKCTC